jgi:hypothetical protein
MDTHFPAKSGLRRVWFARQLKLLAFMSGLVALLALRVAAQTNPLVVTTLAGLGNFGAADGIGAVAKFYYPSSVALDGLGNVYVADPYNDTIRKVTPTGVVTTLAGLAQTFGTNDGTGTNARLDRPFGVAVDTLGNVFVADTYNSTIREISTNGAVTTFAGITGLIQYRDGYVTNLGTTTNYATFGLPYGIAIDGSNNIYVADTYANLIRKIAFDVTITNWFVSTLAGDNNTNDIAGNNNFGTNDGAGTSARFNHPYALATDSAGDVYVADTSNNLIRLVTPAGVVTTIAGAHGNGTFSSPSGIAVDGATNIYVADTDHQIIQVLVTTNGTNWVVSPSSPLAGQTNLYGDGDGSNGPASATLNSPWGLAVDSLTNVYVGDSFNGNIRKITSTNMLPTNSLSTLAGPDGSFGVAVPGTNAAQARFHQPNGVALDAASNIYVADSLNNCIRQVTPDGLVTNLAGSTIGSSGTNDGTGSAALFNYPTGLCLDAATNIYVTDYGNSTVRMISPTFSGGVTNWVTATISGQATNFSYTNGQGGNATFNGPFGVAVDSSTNLYVTDNGNGTIRLLTLSNMIWTVTNYTPDNALPSPVGIAVDSSTNLYVTDDQENLVYIVPPNGVASVFDSGDEGLLNSPEGIALDRSSNVYVANSGSDTILGFNGAGQFKKDIAGTAGFVGSADGIGNAAQFDNPVGLAVDASSNVYVADAFNNTIRLGTPFYAGQTAVLTLTTSPSGLPIEVGGTTYPVTPDVFAYATGSSVMVTATTTIENSTAISTNYYAFTDWTANGGGTNSSSSFSFTLNSNETLVANYAPLYTFTVSASPVNGGTANGGGTNVAMGTVTSVTATSLSDYRFTNWTINGYQVSTNANYTFPLNGDYALVANFLPPLYTNSVSASPTNGGTAIASSGASSGTNLILVSNSMVTVTATAETNPSPGYAFIDWSTNGGGTNANASYTFPLLTNEALVANFSPYYILTVTDAPADGGSSIASCGGTNNIILTAVSNSMVTVTATAFTTPGPGYAFVDWVTNGGGTNFNASYTFPLQATETLVANFAPYYTLTVTNLPNTEGTVSAICGSTNSTTLTVLSNSLVTVAASAVTAPSPGYAFVDWVTNGGGTNTNASYTFPLETNETLVGNFAPYYILTLSNTSGGTSIASCGGTNSTSLTVVANSMVAATATPSNDFAFTGWTTTNGAPVSLLNPYTFALDANETLLATFVPTYIASVITNPPSGGTVSGAGTYDSNSIVLLLATTNPGYAFADWTLSTTNGVEQFQQTNFSFRIDSNVTYVANFETTPPQIGVYNGTSPITNGETTVNFGSVQQNQQDSVTFMVTNFGGRPLVLTNLLVVPANGFALDTIAPATITNFPFTIVGVTNDLPTNGTFLVQLITTTVGTSSGTVTITNNDPINGSFSFAVKGIVAPPAPQIEVLQGAIVITNSQATPVPFGLAVQNQPGTSVTFTVKDTGDLPLVLTNITAPPGYTLITNSQTTIKHFPFTIASNNSGTFVVQINQGTVVDDSGNIIIDNNDPTNNPFSIPITSEVITKIIALGGHLAFGVLPLDSPPTNGSLTISNIGNTVLTVTSIIYPPFGFGANWSGSNAIEPGASTSMTVTFTATAATNYSGPVTVKSDATSGTSNYFISAFGANTNLLLTVLTNGDGLVTPNEAKFLKAKTKYTLKAVPGSGNVFNGWTGSTNSTNNPLTFAMAESTIFQANFITNPFLPFVGTYNGLFWATNGEVTETNAGMLKGLALTSKGTYSGSLLINGTSKSLSGSFNTALQTSKTITRTESQGGNLEVVMTLISNTPAPQVTGMVSNANWLSINLTADRATNNNQISLDYTMLLSPDANAGPANSPSGYGYALIASSQGTTKTPATAKITGALADGTAFSQSVPVSMDGYVPIYANLYSSKGLLLGWINLELTNTDGVGLTWIHPVARSGLFGSGFTNVLSTGQILLSQWSNTSGNFESVTNLSMFDTNVLTNITVSITDFKMTGTEVNGSIAPKTGLLTVTIGSGASKVTGHGAILLNPVNGTSGGGYMLNKTNTGSILLAPASQ